MKQDYFFINILLIVLLFAHVINYYLFRTTFLVEFISIIIFIYGYFIQKKKYTKTILPQFYFLLYLILILLISIIQSHGIIGSLGKETYRFFSILLFTISLFVIDLPYEENFKFILLLCKFYLFYTIYELLYINLINPGNFNGLIFGDAILDFYKNDYSSPYLLPQGDFISPYVRPFGLTLQPQKSSFIYSFAIIILYILKNDFNWEKTNDKWYYLFIVGSVLAGGTTALLCNLVLFTIIKIDFFKRFVTFKQFLLLIIISFSLVPIIIVSFNYLNSSEMMAVAINKEFHTYFNRSFIEILFGIGFIESKQFEMLGFSGESFIFRILIQIGVINFVLLMIFSFNIFKNKNKRVSIMLISLLFFMCIHYAIVNIYIYIFIISLILIYEKKKPYNCNT